MTYLLDTDTLSGMMRPVPSRRLAERASLVPRSQQFTSAVTLAELLYGAERAGRHDLVQRIEAIARVVPILPFDADAARIYARLRSGLERQGTPLAEADLSIASIAIEANLILVTGNVRHFGRVLGLRVENWFA